MEIARSEKGIVCVTGASGYFASWLVKRLLEKGYHVRGTVRDPQNLKKVGHLWKLHEANERLELVSADLLDDGSFDNAVVGCHTVFHTASPVITVKSDPKDEIVDPAVNGTLNVLRSCKKSESVKRVVVTSSSSAVRARDDWDYSIPFDESSWSSIELCNKYHLWYAMAKTLAEKAAWDFARENSLDIVTILPVFLIGPSIPSELCSTASDVLGLLKGEKKRFEMHGRMGYVDIDDAAESHILAMENPSAHGRYICSSTVLDINDLAQTLASLYPDLNIASGFENKGDTSPYTYNTTKIQKLGIQFKGIEEMFKDTITSLKQQGYL